MEEVVARCNMPVPHVACACKCTAIYLVGRWAERRLRLSLVNCSTAEASMHEHEEHKKRSQFQTNGKLAV
jgi:hypothetical protein